jgi:hypothetical protein
MPGNFVHNDTNPQATIGREDRQWYAMYADDVYATDVHGDIEGTTGINDDVQAALDLKAPLASPALTGTPTTPDAASGTDTSQIANCRFVANAIASGGGTGTRSLFSGLMSAVPTQSLTGLNTWVNQGSATIAETDAGLTIYSPAHSGTSLNMLIKSAPSTPYTITGLFARSCRQKVGYPQAGFGWYASSSGKVLTLGWNSDPSAVAQLMVAYLPSPTSWGGAYVTDAYFSPGCIWLRLVDDGTTVYFKFSHDGVHFVTMYSVAKSSSYLGSAGHDKICIFADGQSYPIYWTVMSYAEAASAL